MFNKILEFFKEFFAPPFMLHNHCQITDDEVEELYKLIDELKQKEDIK
jgi:hypothetical protein